MTDTNVTHMQEKLDKLEVTVNKLLAYCQKISEENQLYKSSNNELLVERSELQSKNDKVRSKVEAMVDRLKAVDKAS